MEGASRFKKLLWTIFFMLVMDAVADTLRITLNLYPENVLLTIILGIVTAIFAVLFTGVLKEDPQNN